MTTSRQKLHRHLIEHGYDLALSKKDYRYGSLVDAPNPQLLKTSNVELRRYHERAIVSNRYKSLEWSAIALMLMADMIADSAQYKTAKAQGLEFSQLANKFIELAKQEINGPQRPNPARSDYDELKYSLEKQAKQVLEFFYKDTGLLAKNGKRASYSPKELDSIFDKQAFIIECEIEEGLLDTSVMNNYTLLEQRVAEVTGYTIGYVRRQRNEWEARCGEACSENRAIEAANSIALQESEY